MHGDRADVLHLRGSLCARQVKRDLIIHMAPIWMETLRRLKHPFIDII